MQEPATVPAIYCEWISWCVGTRQWWMALHRGEEPLSKPSSLWKMNWGFPSLGVKLNSFSTYHQKISAQIPSWSQSVSAKKNSAATTGVEILTEHWFSDRWGFSFFFLHKDISTRPCHLY